MDYEQHTRALFAFQHGTVLLQGNYFKGLPMQNKKNITMEECLFAEALLCPESEKANLGGFSGTTFDGIFHSRVNRNDILLHQLQRPWPESYLFIQIVGKTGSF